MVRNLENKSVVPPLDDGDDGERSGESAPKLHPWKPGAAAAEDDAACDSDFAAVLSLAADAISTSATAADDAESAREWIGCLFGV